jgi:hypothetical protein
MNLDPIISALLFEAESAELDFKSEQYSFEGVDDRVKSELLKDILAFSNAWRRSDAYILIGVKEVKEAESEVVGITKHIDDASLQEFVNSKTNRPVDFSYNPTSFRGKQIGVIHIPVQDRPTFLKRDFGKLRRNIVYLRRGSSTVEALPDEIARMGQAVSDGLKLAPILVPRLATSSDWSNLTEIETFEAVHLNSLEIKSLPDYSPPASTDLSGRTLYSIGRTNSDYFRDRAEYLRFSAKLRPIRFAVCNEGTAIASGVKLSSHVADPAHSLEFQLGSDRPKQPRREWLPIDYLRSNKIVSMNQMGPDIEVLKTSAGWTICAYFGKIQAKDTKLTSEQLFMGMTKSGTIELPVLIFADEISNPVSSLLSLNFVVSERELTHAELTS